MQEFWRRIRTSALMRRLFEGAVWSMGGEVVIRLLTAGLGIIFARLLGKETFGQLAILQSTMNMVVVFAGLGMGLTATKYVAEWRTRDVVKLGRIFGLIGKVAIVSALATGTALVLGADFIAATVIKSPELAPLLRIMSLAVVFYAMDIYQSGALIGFGMVRHSVLGGLAATLIGVPISIFLTLRWGLQGAVIGIVVTAFLRAVASGYLLRAGWRRWGVVPTGKNSSKEWRSVRDFAFPALLSGLMVTPAHWICHTMLIDAEGGPAQMAILAVASQWYFAFLLLPIAVNRVILPALTDAAARGDGSQSIKVMLAGIGGNLLLVVPIAAIAGLLSPFIMGLYGEGFREGWPVMLLMIITASLSALVQPMVSVITARGHMWLGASSNLGWAVIYVGGVIYLLDYGAFGVVQALFGAYVVHAVWTLVWAMKLLNTGSAQTAQVAS